MFLIETEQRQDYVQIGLLAVAFLGYHILYLGVRDDAVARMASLIASQSLIEPDRKPEHNSVKAVLFQWIVAVIKIDDVIRAIFPESDLFLVRIAFTLKKEHLGKNEYGIIDLLGEAIPDVRNTNLVSILTHKEIRTKADFTNIRIIVGIFLKENLHEIIPELRRH